MLSKAKIVGFALAVLTAPVAQGQAVYLDGETLFNNSACGDCHESPGAEGLQAIRNQIAQRLQPAPGLNYTKSLAALKAALDGVDLDTEATGMDGLFPVGTFSDAMLANLAVYIANMPTPAPTLTYLPFPGPIFPPTAVGATSVQTITVTNTGTLPLVFAINGAAQIAAGQHADDYSVTAAQCQATTLQSGVGSCTVNIQFRPVAGTDVGRAASLSLQSTTSAAPAQIPLFGTLQASAPASTPPTGTAPAPSTSANAPSGGALPWQMIGVLLIALLPPRVRRSVR
ncbi:MAG: hypothetical protein ABJA83_12860 [Burkholderiaceae bacterium]